MAGAAAGRSPEYRDQPNDIRRFYVRTAAGDMVPLSTLVHVESDDGPEVIYRYNRFRATKLIGINAPGYSSGQAAAAMEKIAHDVLPAGFGYEWTGTVYQQKLSEGKEGYIFGFAGVLVFLFLAALYESWSIPFAVILAVPLGIFGALAGIWLRSYPYDVYTQIGIVTLIGLAAKNAILIVEYAKMRREEGLSIHDAAMDAATLRLRPILMTSFAFLLGVAPLMFATGAGAASRRSLGTAVFSGMVAATLLAVFIVPVLYVVIDRVRGARQGTWAVCRNRARRWEGRLMRRVLAFLCLVGVDRLRGRAELQTARDRGPPAVPKREATSEFARGHEMVRSVQRRQIDRNGQPGSGAELRSADRGGAGAGSARAIGDHALAFVSAR